MDMPRSYKQACSHAFVPDEDPPELATNDEWRGIMRRARKAHLREGAAMTQAQLASEVGRRIRERWPSSTLEAPSQVAMSKIESGANKSSKFILPICDVLGIPQPSHLTDEDDLDWVRLGRKLRHGSLDEYKALMAMLERAADRLDSEEQQADEQEDSSAQKPK